MTMESDYPIDLVSGVMGMLQASFWKVQASREMIDIRPISGKQRKENGSIV